MGLYASGNIHCLSESKFYFRVSGLSARWYFCWWYLYLDSQQQLSKCLFYSSRIRRLLISYPEAGFGFIMYRFGDNSRETLQRKIASSVLKNFWENLCLRNNILSRQQFAQIQCDLPSKYIFPTRPKSESARLLLIPILYTFPGRSLSTQKSDLYSPESQLLKVVSVAAW